MSKRAARTSEVFPRWRYSKRITRREANRAIYFDFEGRMDETPVLLGVYGSGWTRQFVFDRAFTPVVRISRAAGQRVFNRTLGAAVEKFLLKPAEGEERRLIAFSEHELRAIHKYLGPETAERVARRFLNARAFAAAWVSRDRPDLRQRDAATLEDFASICDYEWPDEVVLEPAKTIVRLRAQFSQLAANRREVGSPATDLWNRLLLYNRHDCLATKHIVVHALNYAKRLPHLAKAVPVSNASALARSPVLSTRDIREKPAPPTARCEPSIV